MTEHYIPSTQSTVLIGCITIPNLILMEPTSTLPSSRRPIDNALGSDSTIRDEASESKFSGREIRESSFSTLFCRLARGAGNHMPRNDFVENIIHVGIRFQFHA
jgi:hypothetical protein